MSNLDRNRTSSFRIAPVLREMQNYGDNNMIWTEKNNAYINLKAQIQQLC